MSLLARSLWAVLFAIGCSVDTQGLGGADGGSSGLDAAAADAPVAADARVLPGVEAGPASDAGRMDSGEPGGLDAGSRDAGSDSGPSSGTVIWQRLGPDYPPGDFNSTPNMHFEGSEIHVPGMCWDLEIVAIADPASADWRNYSVSVSRVRFDSVGCGGGEPSFTIVARTPTRGVGCGDVAGYGCSIDFDDNRIRVGRRDGSCGWAPGSNTSSPGSINTGVQYALEIEVRDSTVTCRFDDGAGSRSSINYTDSARTHGTGGVAFVFDDVDARFGDPTVTAR